MKRTRLFLAAEIALTTDAANTVSVTLPTSAKRLTGMAVLPLDFSATRPTGGLTVGLKDANAAEVVSQSNAEVFIANEAVAPDAKFLTLNEEITNRSYSVPYSATGVGTPITFQVILRYEE